MWTIEYRSTNLVASHRGTLPVLVTCPHGGRAAPDDVPERKGKTTPPDCNFEKSSDLNTSEIAHGVAQRMLNLFGEAPYVVVAQFHRKFLDANRSRRCAFESPAAGRYYDEYHRTVRAFVDDIRAEHGGIGLLFDIHGTAGIASDPADVYLGTADGQTIARLLEADPQAMWRRRSLRGFLQAAGHVVSPKRPGDPEAAPLNGGFTVREYGSSNDDGIDAIQLELAAPLRSDKGRREALIEQLAFAFANLAHRWVDGRATRADVCADHGAVGAGVQA
jgi:N-formylglutamate amidohydrolase